MVCGTYNELVTGAYKPTNITRGPHIVWIYRVYGIYMNLSESIVIYLGFIWDL